MATDKSGAKGGQRGPAGATGPAPDLAAAIRGFDASVPVLMLPVRIETRYAERNRALKVRIFPDQIHISAHQPGLTDDEIAAAQWYWRERWRAPGSDAEGERGRAAFRELARRFRPQRARWIVEAMAPVNLASAPRADEPRFPSPPALPTNAGPVRAALLPTRWLIAGYAAPVAGPVADSGDPVFLKATGPVGELGLAPAGTAAPGTNPEREGVLGSDAATRWITDFAEAEARGMAAVIRDSDLTPAARARGVQVSSPLARLVVFGIRSGASADRVADEVAELLRGHIHGDGAAWLKPGTPTNNAEEAASGLDSGREAMAAIYDPLAQVDAEAGALLAAALGLGVAAPTLPGTAGRDQPTTGHLADALWNATLGQTLDQLFDPLLDDAALARARAHTVAWLRPGGPLPALRIGRQPYALLPVVAPGRFRAGTPDEAAVHAIVSRVRPFWERAVERAPRLARAGQPLDRNLEEVLQAGPLAQANRFRSVFGPQAFAAAGGDPAFAALQEATAGLALEIAGIDRPVRVTAFTAEIHHKPLDAPWVQPGAVGEEPLAPNYLTEIASEIRMREGRAALSRRLGASSLLEVLAAHSAIYEIDKAAAAIGRSALRERDPAIPVAANAALRIAELANLPEDGAGPPNAIRVATPEALAALVLPGRTADLPLAAHVAVAASNPRAPDHALTADLRRVAKSLAWLGQRPADELDRALRGFLDSCSHRLDSWATALASRRLATWRARPQSRGLQVGGFGWVEDLRPGPVKRSEGFVRAPSLEQARTAALMVSGHLAHRDGASDAGAGAGADGGFAVDLSAGRTRVALGLLEGVTRGRPIAELLGYRFERDLVERGPQFARLIPALRVRFGGAEESGGPDPECRVIDGVALAEARRAGGDWLRGLGAPLATSEREAIDAAATMLDGALDAVGDLLLAESVHQLASGNTERAAAALGALDRQERPGEITVVRTPGSGTAYAQRALVLLGDAVPTPAWPRSPDDMRARAEPRLDAWIGGLLGDPGRFGFAARLNGDEARMLTPVGLAELGLSPLALVALARDTRENGASELRDAIAACFWRQASPAEREGPAELVLLADAPSGCFAGLAVLEALLARFSRLVFETRALVPGDLGLPGIATEVPPGGGELASRVTAVRAALAAARDRITAACALQPPGEAAFAAALEAARLAGARGATPRGWGSEALMAQARETGEEIGQRLAAEAAASAEPDNADGEAAVARLKALLGEDFPVLPPFAPPGDARDDLAAAGAAQATLLGAARLPLHGWLEQMRRVRPALARLADCLTAAGFVTGDLAPLAAVQRPHATGARWIGLPFLDGAPPAVAASLVVHAPGVDLANPPHLVAGLAVDEWTEVVPGTSATTGVAFHYDAPGARPPQTMLLAVHPDPAARNWELGLLLDTVNEALDLARIRAVRPRDLEIVGSVLPLIYLPENSAGAVPGPDLGAIRARVRAAAEAKG